MILDGKIDLEVPAEKAWDFLIDINKFSTCLPGIDEVKQIDDKTENEGHWAGLISAPITYVVDPSGKVRWAYVSESASERPSPVALAKAAVSVSSGKKPLASYPGKS